MKNNYISGQFIKKSWLKLFTAFVLTFTLMCSNGKQISVSAATPTPGAAFTCIDATGGIYIVDVDTATYGKNIVIPNMISGKVVVGVSLSDKGLTSLDVSNCIELKELICGKNKLTSLDLSKNTKLTSLSYSYTNLTLDLSKNTALENLFCNCNNLTTLDVSKNTALTYFTCISNKLTTLDVSKNTALQTLYCQDNKITALDVSKNTALTNIQCQNNSINNLSALQAWANISGHSGNLLPQNSGATPVTTSTAATAKAPTTTTAKPNTAAPASTKTPEVTTTQSPLSNSNTDSESSLANDNSPLANSSLTDSQSSLNDDKPVLTTKTKDKKGIPLPVIIIIILIIILPGAFFVIKYFRKNKFKQL